MYVRVAGHLVVRVVCCRDVSFCVMLLNVSIHGHMDNSLSRRALVNVRGSNAGGIGAFGG